MHALTIPRITAQAARMAACAVVLILAGCGGSDRNSGSGPQGNPVGVSPAQAGYDAAVVSVDQIVTPVGGDAVLGPAAITAAQTAFDAIADGLIAL